MSRCEDYPCCGHTDGLGCNWVSPNEIQLCMECADARVDRPYHTMWEGDCPTAAKRDKAQAIEDSKADYAIEDTDKVCSCDAPAGYRFKRWYLCEDCLEAELRDEELDYYASLDPYDRAAARLGMHEYDF